MNGGAGARPAEVAWRVWKVALVNFTLSPALTWSAAGKNALSVAPLGVPAGGLACSPKIHLPA